MAGRFVGRWKDRTASRRLCHPHRILFVAIALFGIALFALLQIRPAIFGVIYASLPTKVDAALRMFDAIALPRSLGDFDLIDERRGMFLFEATFLTETLLAMSGTVAIALMLTRVDLAGVDDDFSVVQFWIRFLIAFCCLLFRPAQFTYTSITNNYVDGSGFFLAREGVLIAAGYYNVALMLTDAFGRMTRRFRGPVLALDPAIPASHDGMEPR